MVECDRQVAQLTFSHGLPLNRNLGGYGQVSGGCRLREGVLSRSGIAVTDGQPHARDPLRYRLVDNGPERAATTGSRGRQPRTDLVRADSSVLGRAFGHRDELFGVPARHRRQECGIPVRLDRSARLLEPGLDLRASLIFGLRVLLVEKAWRR